MYQKAAAHTWCKWSVYARHRPVKTLADVTPEEVDRILKVNIQGVLWGIQAAANTPVRGLR